MLSVLVAPASGEKTAELELLLAVEALVQEAEAFHGEIRSGNEFYSRWGDRVAIDLRILINRLMRWIMRRTRRLLEQLRQ